MHSVSALDVSGKEEEDDLPPPTPLKQTLSENKLKQVHHLLKLRLLLKFEIVHEKLLYYKNASKGIKVNK